jgi:hypothetical protein
MRPVIDTSLYKRPGIYTKEYDVTDLRPTVTEEMIEHFNLLYKMVGIDMTFDRWACMSPDERKKFERDIKIKKLLDI